ncbi:hypothetical protein I5M27_16685 [Adhaeribacter sp. BT258]|uniref:Guanylate cyclase domain-containing protein n=1 Tax=Adhaeribacter terrigena TaxID=2793070 RepID=A0ABS1C5H5_9BACT|nr:hypothetical protein [Adhaeribacter terrigena]MBK0404635.1 hypothetical protein [Adhaeribacter terrigena]
MKVFKTIENTITIAGEKRAIIKKDNYESFSESILGLGNIENKSNLINGLSIMFDLEGFTNFCKQIDPQLAVPEYLSEFLKWIFKQIREELIVQEHPEGYELYSAFPFLSKFLGDGLLFLWDTEKMAENEITNIVISMQIICKKYTNEFYPEISKKIVDAPKKLRCGIARGAIYSVGNGEDFVGPCINMSARLQKLSTLGFCFSRRGINPDSMSKKWSEKFITKKVNIRGIGENEIVGILKEEFDNLTAEEKKIFK